MRLPALGILPLAIAPALLPCATRTLVPALAVAPQSGSERVEWNRPYEPFRIVGNVYYVGASGVSSFLITSRAGSILLDGGLPETAAQIARNVEALGFRIADVKFLLNSHAHFDHAGGLAELQRLSNAAIAASARDAEALRAGGRDMPAVTVERIVADGDTISVGDVRLTARLTPGHTKGCTTWTTTAAENGRSHDVVFYCSTSVVDRLVGNSGYPEIVADYEKSFAILRGMRSDVFLGPHPMFFSLDEKRKRMRAGEPNPFIDRAELQRSVSSSERRFRAELKKQQSTR